MIEYTHVKVSPPYKLAARDGLIFCMVDDSRGGRMEAGPAGSASSIVAMGATVLWALLRLIGGLLYMLCSRLVVPVVREIVCILGAGLFYTISALLGLLSVGFEEAGSTAVSCSRLLRATTHTAPSPLRSRGELARTEE